ncbi:MAG: transcriptional repressor LexA [Ruminococcaceae bacterium]|nr:transcriptional repressor LexA [Oscillospiraceae bacterium]
MHDLTKKQQEVFNFIKNYIEKNGYPPAVRDICKGVNLSSPSSVHAHINSLVEMGYLKKDLLKKRAISISDNYREESDIYKGKENGIDYLEVPVIGQVAAGQPILAAENVERTFPLPMDFAKNKDVFMLRVKGDSMINAGIFDGDYVIVRREDTASNGNIIVALIDDSATVKTFYKENGYFRLQPENDYMEPIIVNELKVLGRVIGLIRMM